ncbi:MAG TPA: hydrogenase maturation nickel metallochaperone HypA [Chroococcales cyanobacterium]
MHEAVIASSILNIAVANLKQIAPENGRVTAIDLSVGEFRNVEIESLRFAFDNLKLDHPGCESAVLVVNPVTAIGKCSGAGHVYVPRFDSAFRCPECGSGVGTLLAGEELDITNMELQATNREERCTNARNG